MASLFIDSTYDITLGILNDAQEWSSFQRFSGQKSSAVLQRETHRLLQEAGVKPRELKHVFTLAGPGFYTGLRLSEGVADVFTFVGIPHFSFLSYDIPGMLGIKSGTWMTKAYRGEVFFHEWDQSSSKNILIPEKELAQKVATVDKSSFYIHSDSALDEISRNLVPFAISSHHLLQQKPKEIFNQVLSKKMKVDSFYFRAPEDEFRVNP